MNKLTYILIAAAVLFVFSGITNAHAADSAGVPCGALELIEYVANKQEPSMTAEEFYNKVLFDKDSYLDNFAVKPNPTNLKSGQQKIYHKDFCDCDECEKGTYYSYENFVAALEPGYFNNEKAKFCCEDHMTTEDRLLELAEFLATVASETTGGSTHTNDGFYWRYENGALDGADMDVPPKEGHYVPPEGWKVARSTKDETLLNTQIFWGSYAANQANEYYPAETPCKVIWQKDVKVPDGYELCNMNEIIQKGYWVGMGPTQLTGDTMFGFFGWYHNNVEKKEAADYAAFVQKYLKAGELGFLGALWYWNAREAGNSALYRTVHEAVTLEGHKVCHGISCATLMVNGGCNDFSNNRLLHFLYFVKKLLGEEYDPLYREEYTRIVITRTLDTLNCPCTGCPKPGPTEEDKQYWTLFLNVCREKH